MKMRIAFLIGVSDYEKLNSLRATENDVVLMQSIIKSLDKYDEIYVIKDKDTNSKRVVNLLSEAIEKNKTNTVDELLFYFSGHGKYENDEFYYALADYDDTKKRQTSLINSDLDEMLKTLSPKLVVKIVDACNSGLSYVKDTDEENNIQKHFDSSGKKFEQCYFMFSCRQNQNSYIKDGKLSEFTKSFINSVILTDKNEIRYKDIINYISDEFETNKEQRPFFVNQASFIEKFGSFEDKIKEQIKHQLDLLYKSLEAEIIDENSQNVSQKINLKDIIIEDSKDYCSKEEALAVLVKIKTYFESYDWNLELSEFFDIHIQQLESEDDGSYKITKIEDIGVWLNKNENNFFAKPLYKTEEYTEMVPVNNNLFGGSLAFLAAAATNRRIETKPVKSSRKVVSSFQNTFSQPYFSIRVYLKPKEEFQNLNPFDFTLVYLISKTDIKLFYYYSTYIETAWNIYKANTKISWENVGFKLKDNNACNINIENIAKGFENFVIKNLKSRFNIENN